ncbi:MAG: hypothetical protein H0T42_18810, partial [Deltaproteobacteria bacterium]|nr:hypothetical protein [Deltaproteobacteria bacterium]
MAAAFAIGIALAPMAPHVPGWAGWLVAGALALAARWHRGFVVAAVVAAGITLAAPGSRALPAGVQADDRHLDRIVGVV